MGKFFQKAEPDVLDDEVRRDDTAAPGAVRSGSSAATPYVGCRSRRFAAADRAPPPHDPVFLPDFATLTPDQAQEMRYGKGRDQ